MMKILILLVFIIPSTIFAMNRSEYLNKCIKEIPAQNAQGKESWESSLKTLNAISDCHKSAIELKIQSLSKKDQEKLKSCILSNEISKKNLLGSEEDIFQEKFDYCESKLSFK